MSELMQASNQWATRPADERYKSLPELHQAVETYYNQAREAKGVAFSTLRVEAQGPEVVLVGKANVPSKLTHFAFGQVAQRIGAPAELGASKDEVLDAVFKMGIQGLSRGLIAEGYEKAAEHEDWYGSPRTVFGLTSGLTEIARDMPFADERTQLDRAAGKLMQVAF